MVIKLSNCEHEEADTRLMLRAAHAANYGHETIVIKSPDPDVFILGLYSKISLPETSMFFYTGSGEHSRMLFFDVILSSMLPALSSASPGLHAFTGWWVRCTFPQPSHWYILRLITVYQYFTLIFISF